MRHFSRMDNNFALNPTKYLSPEEQAHLEEICVRNLRNDSRNAVLLLLMLHTGARPQEVLNLQWADIFWSTNQVFIKTIKGGRPRAVHVNNDILHYLRTLNRGVGKIFNIKYRRLNAVWQMYRPCHKKLHSLRHTFAVNLYRQTKDPWLVQKALGHKSIATTSIYLEMESTMEDLRRALSKNGLYVPWKED